VFLVAAGAAVVAAGLSLLVSDRTT
jgi:hypothetical protein